MTDDRIRHRDVQTSFVSTHARPYCKDPESSVNDVAISLAAPDLVDSRIGDALRGVVALLWQTRGGRAPAGSGVRRGGIAGGGAGTRVESAGAIENIAGAASAAGSRRPIKGECWWRRHRSRTTDSRRGGTTEE